MSTKGKRRYLLMLVCRVTRGLWNADYRWAQKRGNEFRRRFNAGGFAWWQNADYRVSLKPKRGQKR